MISTAYSQFNYSPLDELVGMYVQGNSVNYSKLLKDKEKLISFTDSLATISPNSHPERFKTRNEQLAYWINAYNAYILKIIIENYPVDSIKDIKFIGFTVWLHKNTLGGEEISFKSLEDDIIRDMYQDPRIHFAINCASVSCPPLRNKAYFPGTLDQQMDESTSIFINDTNNFRIAEEEGKIYLSSIFDWYDDDYIDWLREKMDIEEPHILDYIKVYYKGQFNEEWYDYDIEFLEYDWSLNDIKGK
jgi:hypothetical protein